MPIFGSLKGLFMVNNVKKQHKRGMDLKLFFFILKQPFIGWPTVILHYVLKLTNLNFGIHRINFINHYKQYLCTNCNS